MGRNNLVGAWGEELAANFLKKKRYKIIGTNFHCRYGEIDLIAQYQRFLVFVEVKVRKSSKFAQACEFVDIHKQNRLRTTAEFYLFANPTELQPLFDVVEIYAPDGTATDKPTIQHMEDAF